MTVTCVNDADVSVEGCARLARVCIRATEGAGGYPYVCVTLLNPPADPSIHCLWSINSSQGTRPNHAQSGAENSGNQYLISAAETKTETAETPSQTATAISKSQPGRI